jgi:polyhydroxyalkanoate synthesis regulator phasin
MKDKLKKPKTTRQLLESCEKLTERMIKVIDTIFDKGDINNKSFQDMLKDASDILNKIEEMEKELEQILTK